MALISVFLMAGVFWGIAWVAIAIVGAALVGLICLIVSIIVNIVSIRRKKKKSIPAIVFIIIGSLLMLPLGITAIFVSVTTGNYENQKEAKEKEKLASLEYSISENDIAKVKQKLATGADPNQPMKDYNNYGEVYSLLGLAISNRNLSIVEILLEAGADPTKGLSDALYIFTPGLREGDLHYINLLIEKGANVLVMGDGGESTLMQLIFDLDNSESYYNQSDNMHELIYTINLLIEKGVDINAADDDGDTALILACGGMGELDFFAFVNDALVLFLLEKGADKNHKNDMGKKAIDYFVGAHDETIQEYDRPEEFVLKREDSYYKALEMLSK